MSDFGSGPAPVLLNRLLPHADAPVIEDGAVLAVHGRIAAVGPWAAVSREAAPDVGLVELGDRTLLPGLIDCHVHLAMDESVTSTVIELTATEAELACRMVSSAGVDMIEHCGWATENGSRLDPDIARRIVERGIVVCPTMNSRMPARSLLLPVGRARGSDRESAGDAGGGHRTGCRHGRRHRPRTTPTGRNG
jgi:hypothetical protein